MKSIKKIAILHSLCTVGKASLTNMIPVLSTMGIEACPIPTVLLSTHTGGYKTPARQTVDADYLRMCADHYRENGVAFDAIFVGYLGSVDMALAVQYFLEQFPEATVILDPIMGDQGTLYANLNEDYVQAFLKLFPYADIILPNFTEACLLTGTVYEESCVDGRIRLLCEALHHKGANSVIITSIPTADQTKGIVLSQDHTIESFFLDGEATEFHGTGDVFDAVFCGAYLLGQDINTCIYRAHDFVRACIKESASSSYPKREGLILERNLSLLV